MAGEVPGAVTIGPWSGTGGTPWNAWKANTRIIEVDISYDNTGVTSLAFIVKDTGTGGTSKLGPYGGGGGTSFNLSFNPEEYLTNIEGTIVRDSKEGIQSLTFYTNLSNYGPYGPTQGPPFKIPIKNSEIVGFFGRAGAYIDNIGFYAKPTK